MKRRRGAAPRHADCRGQSCWNTTAQSKQSRPEFAKCHERLPADLSSLLIGCCHLRSIQLRAALQEVQGPCSGKVRIRPWPAQCSLTRYKQDVLHSGRSKTSCFALAAWLPLCSLTAQPSLRWGRAHRHECTLQREQGFREWNVTARSGPPPSCKLCQLSSSQAGTLPSITMLGRKRFMSMGCSTLLFRSSRDDCMDTEQ